MNEHTRWLAVMHVAIETRCYGMRFRMVLDSHVSLCACVCISEAMTTRQHNHMNFVPQSHTHERAWRWHNFQSICEFSIVTTTIASITNTNRCNINLITLREMIFGKKRFTLSVLLACVLAFAFTIQLFVMRSWLWRRHFIRMYAWSMYLCVQVIAHTKIHFNR